ncbi:MAG: hypothetical protein OXC65_04970, partial [Thiotrichales bacterium]|nr:hypothetical protein [Thiotrichales bacterium]
PSIYLLFHALRHYRKNVYLPVSDYAEAVRIDGPHEVDPAVAAVAEVWHVARLSRRSPRRDPASADLYLRAKLFATGASDGALRFDCRW